MSREELYRNLRERLFFFLAREIPGRPGWTDCCDGPVSICENTSSPDSIKGIRAAVLWTYPQERGRLSVVSVVVFEREVVDEEHTAVTAGKVVAILAGRSNYHNVGGDARGVAVFEVEGEGGVLGYRFARRNLGIGDDVRVVLVEYLAVARVWCESLPVRSSRPGRCISGRYRVVP